MKTLVLATVMLCVALPVWAVDSVDPNGVNINSTGATTVFLTFRGTTGQTTQEAFWCGEITVPANTVSNQNPCVPGTFFGSLPVRFDQGRTEANNFTDIMTIPPSVARRAMQSARDGNKSSFFYVRKFESNGAAQYIAVTCRMAGGGARVPFALTEARPYFDGAEGQVAVHLAAQKEALPSTGITLIYNGTGRLKGRWEIVKPGDVLPEEFDLLPEASLPLSQRGLQKRYQVLQSFDIFLPPNGEASIPGPEPEILPNTLIGPYQVLFRIEATFDKEGNSNTGVVTVASGGAAGFAMPTLRYYVGSDEDVSQARREAGLEKTLRLLPVKQGEVNGSNLLLFNWLDIHYAAIYKLELHITGEEPFVAIRKSGLESYQLPPWIQAKALEAGSARWRVSAFNKNGKRLARSDWQKLTLTDNNPQ